MVLGSTIADSSYDGRKADLIRQANAHGADLCSKKPSPVLVCPDTHGLLGVQTPQWEHQIPLKH